MIRFASKVLDKVLVFVGRACKQGEAGLEDTIRFKGGSLFLSRRSNNWGRFICLCQWKQTNGIPS